MLTKYHTTTKSVQNRTLAALKILRWWRKGINAYTPLCANFLCAVYGAATVYLILRPAKKKPQTHTNVQKQKHLWFHKRYQAYKPQIGSDIKLFVLKKHKIFSLYHHFQLQPQQQ